MGGVRCRGVCGGREGCGRGAFLDGRVGPECGEEVGEEGSVGRHGEDGGAEERTPKDRSMAVFTNKSRRLLVNEERYAPYTSFSKFGFPSFVNDTSGLLLVNEAAGSRGDVQARPKTSSVRFGCCIC